MRGQRISKCVVGVFLMRSKQTFEPKNCGCFGTVLSWLALRRRRWWGWTRCPTFGEKSL